MPSMHLSKLKELRPSSNRKLNPTVFSLIQDHSVPRTLVESALIANGKFATKPVNGAISLSSNQNLHNRRKVHTLSASKQQIINRLNHDLSGGDSYPVLTAMLGTLGGMISGGASFIFTVATTGLSMINPVNKVLAREGDEIWHFEEIGRMGNKAVYVSAFFLVDPYRKHAPGKGWLIHEEREELIIN